MEEGGVGGRPVEGRIGDSVATTVGVSRGLRNIVWFFVCFEAFEEINCHPVTIKKVRVQLRIGIYDTESRVGDGWSRDPFIRYNGYREITRSRERQDHILDMSGPQTIFWRTIWQDE